ncbi:uncharacterized protein J3D65DRAFT_602625 [Phyllosticta citribraziliensis]|uniref:Uncharacterized protein n=1 Tax=Phyllosticta citribraziliensis TaxID=989973 RepID=A0ABR1LTX1_9PEZI
MPSTHSSSSSSSLEEDDPHQVRDVSNLSPIPFILSHLVASSDLCDQEINYNNIHTIEPIIRRYIMGEKPNDIDGSRANRLHAIQGILIKLGEGTLTGLEKQFQQHKQIQKAVGPLKRAREKLLRSRKICSMPLKRILEVTPPKRKREVDEDDSGGRCVEEWMKKVEILREDDRSLQDFQLAFRACDWEEEEEPRWPDHPDYIESDVYVTKDDLEKKERRISDLAELEFEHIMTDPGWRESKSGMCNAYWLRRLVVYISRMLTEDGIKCVMDTLSELRGLFRGFPTPIRTLLRNNS